MLVISLTTQLEEAIAAPGVKNASGNIRSFEEFLAPEALVQLEKQHAGIFAFLAFHPRSDRVVTEYVKSGTLASDSGSRILVLFTLDASARFPSRIGHQSFQRWLDLDAEVHPAYQMVRERFLPERVPPLPGIILFGSFSVAAECLYVGLADAEKPEDVRQRLRQLFSLAEESFLQKHSGEPGSWVGPLAVKCQGAGLSYIRSGSSSTREWLARAYRFLAEHKGDLVSVLSLFK